MTKPINTVQKIITYVICWLMTVQPASAANITVNNTVHNTSMSQAGNGVDIVNIATPNSNGLSHNQFEQFNVGKEGVILNNSTAQLATSQLGGILQNNPNLTGGSADVILNEVTGANRSQMNGYTEVFGDKANVIFTNPYGITCNGCGFINTSRVTLSTGNPEFSNGDLSGFNVSQGNIAIEGQGLDATQQSYFDILSRTATINGEIHAKDLAIITGQNKVQYQTNTAVKSQVDGSSTPLLAIDSSLLGGMYAGRIALVATESGVGLNVGNLSSSEGDISLTADGKIVVNKVSSKQDLHIQSSDEVVLKGTQYATQDINVHALSVSAEQSYTAAGEKLALESGHVVLKNSQLVAGINDQGGAQAGGQLTLVADDMSLVGSTVSASDIVNSKVKALSLDNSSQLNAQHVTFSELKLLTNQGDISALQDLSISGGTVSLRGDGVIAAVDASIAVENLDHDSKLVADAVTITAKQNIDVSLNSKINSNETLTIRASNLTNKGVLSSKDKLVMTSDELSNNGNILADGDITVNAAQLNNAGLLSAESDLAVSAHTLNQNGVMQSSKNLSITSTAAFKTGLNSKTVAEGALTLEGASINHQGSLSAQKNVLIKAGNLTNSGDIASVNNIALNVNTLNSQGKLRANKDITIDASAEVITAGKIRAGNNLLLTTVSNYGNSGEISAGQAAQFTVGANLNNQSTGVLSANSIGINAANIDNAGIMQAINNLQIRVATLMNNGVVQSAEALSITSTVAFNTGQ